MMTISIRREKKRSLIWTTLDTWEGLECCLVVLVDCFSMQIYASRFASGVVISRVYLCLKRADEGSRREPLQPVSIPGCRRRAAPSRELMTQLRQSTLVGVVSIIRECIHEKARIDSGKIDRLQIIGIASAFSLSFSFFMQRKKSTSSWCNWWVGNGMSDRHHDVFGA